MRTKDKKTIRQLRNEIIHIISETNGITLNDTLGLMKHSRRIQEDSFLEKLLLEFDRLLSSFHHNEVDIDTLLKHPVSEAFFEFFKYFPLNYHEDHIHLTGSLTAEFIWPHLQKLLEGSNKDIYKKKITHIYGKDAWPITSSDDVDKLIRLNEGERFSSYLKVLHLAKFILIDKKTHADAAYHMANTLYYNYNIGTIRLKFTLSRATSDETEQIPGIEKISEKDIIMGLFEGFKEFQKEAPDFNFVLSPSFRKENDFFDNKSFNSKKEHFDHQVKKILGIIKNNEELQNHLNEVDTVGDERELYRKKHFSMMKEGLRRLQYEGFKIRSHHGENWKNLRKGIQSVDNAMNIWHIDTLEHGLSLGVNPNYYFQRLYQKIISLNEAKIPIKKTSLEYRELMDMDWRHLTVKEKLLAGTPLNEREKTSLIKTKFHLAHEVERYQHDVLNRMINKNVGLVALPTSNMRLTESFPDYKDHPFSWWEKKGLSLGVGTDNYITLSTNFIREMLILLYSDPQDLKIMKLLMVTTKETRRPYMSRLLWSMRKNLG